MLLPPSSWLTATPSERQLGLIAKKRVEQLLARGEVRVLESGKRDKYGRTLAKVTVNGEDLAALMVREGLGRPYRGEKGLSWCMLNAS